MDHQEQIGLVDTHCHLDYLDESDIPSLLKECAENGITQIVTIGVEPKNLEVVERIAGQNQAVFGSLGVHPHHAKDYNQEVAEQIKQGTKNSKIVAVGECGLDYHYDNSPRDVQRRVFEEQLELASQLKLPVVIHTREAEEDTISILKNFSGRLPRSGVFHCYSSGKELAEFALAEGFHLGFTGIITFTQADNVRDVVELTPLERLLIETDAPFLAPKPYRGRRNSPLFLPYIAQEVARIKQCKPDYLTSTLWNNYRQLFFTC